MPVILYLGLVK